jgi:hypothetical protein
VDVWDKSPLPPPDDGGRVEGTDPTSAAGAGSGSGSGGDEPPTDGGENPSGDESPWWSQRIANVPAWLLLLLAIAVWVGIIAALVLPGDSDDRTPPADVEVTIGITTDPATSEPPVATIGKSPAITSTTTTTIPATTIPATTTAPATTTTAPATTTTVPTSTVPTTTTDPTSTVPASTVPTSAGIGAPTTATGANGETLTVTPRHGECRLGPECFIASFTIAGFATQPEEFVCEFSSGARYVFRFSSAGADPACSTLDVPDSIVVEVDGLRTDPVTIGRGD